MTKPQLTLHRPDESDAIDVAAIDRDADLQTVLSAWHEATVRLERTHETLRAEVARLSDELEAKNRELARQNRLADLGRMASHVAHEVRNNLVPVHLYLGLLRRRIAQDDQSLEVLEKIDSGFAALDATVNDLLHFTSDREADYRPLQLRSLVDEILTSLAPQLHAQRIDVEIDIPDRLNVPADRGMLQRALLNLVLNAVDAMRNGGEITLTSYIGPAGWEIEVADTGDGFTTESLQRATEPFFTTKGSGTGLGLAIVERAAAAHGGSLTLANCPQGGAALTLRFPNQALSRAA